MTYHPEDQQAEDAHWQEARDIIAIQKQKLLELRALLKELSNDRNFRLYMNDYYIKKVDDAATDKLPPQYALTPPSAVRQRCTNCNAGAVLVGLQWRTCTECGGSGFLGTIYE